MPCFLFVLWLSCVISVSLADSGIHLITPKSTLVGKEVSVGSGTSYKVKLWVSDEVQRIAFLYVISWFNFLSPSCQMYSLPHWKTFISTIGGAIVVQENVPANEERVAGKRYGFRSDLRKDGGRLAHWLVNSLVELGNKSGHPEVQYAPIVFWGFSREGLHPPSFGEVYPSRLLGGIRYMSHLREDTFDYSGVLHDIPFFTTIGENDNIAKMNNIDFLRNGRKFGNPWSCIVVPGAKHGEGYHDGRTTTFQFPWMIELFHQIPPDLLLAPYQRPVRLARPVTEGRGWLGNMERIIERCCAFRGEPDTHKGSLNGNQFVISPFTEFMHNVSSASWLSCATLAAVWKETNEFNALTHRHQTRPVALMFDATATGSLATLLVVRTWVDIAVQVQLQSNGTAVAGVDFLTFPMQVVLPVGVFGARINVRPAAASPTNQSDKVQTPRLARKELHISLAPSADYHHLSLTGVTLRIPVIDSHSPPPSEAGAVAVVRAPKRFPLPSVKPDAPSPSQMDATHLTNVSIADAPSGTSAIHQKLLAELAEALKALQEQVTVAQGPSASHQNESDLRAMLDQLNTMRIKLGAKSDRTIMGQIQDVTQALEAYAPDGFPVLPTTAGDVSMAMMFTVFITGFILSVGYLYAIKYRRSK